MSPESIRPPTFASGGGIFPSASLTSKAIVVKIRVPSAIRILRCVVPSMSPSRSARSFPALFLGLLLSTGANAQSSCPSSGGCLEPHGGPGCNDQSCCENVCALDPFCCSEWDGSCVTTADASCIGLCGASASGSCFSPHANPSCDDAECCSVVCLIDPYCCQGSWDGNCVFFAGFSCSTTGGDCGDPRAGDCREPNGTPACSDEVCCQTVCDIDGRCCDVVWDSICVAIAESACFGGCELAAQAGAHLEAETCTTASNDPCNGQTAESIGAASAVAGSFRVDQDVDAYELDLTDLDEDADGLVRMRLLVQSELAARLSIRPADCKLDRVFSENVPRCIESFMETCVPAAPLWIEIEPTEVVPSCSGVSYTISFEVRDTCDAPCGTGGDCLEPHESAGCADAGCCSTVCATDPACCDWEWDSSCAVLAADLCGGPPPSNDDCQDAMIVGSGATPFRELLATLDGPASWCGPGKLATHDVWFAYQVTCTDTLFIGTCGAADFDTVVEVFRGDCDGGLESIGCEDDAIACPSGTSLVEITDAICGETLLIRVLNAAGPGGNGDLVINCFGPSCPCPADLDGDGRVGGSDLGQLFVEWGVCTGACTADLDGNGVVGGSDLGLLFSAWGDC